MQVERDRTITRYNLLKAFNSEFSTKIYYILVKWRSVKGKKITFTLDELKERLGVKGKYATIKDFDKWVLEVAKREINQKSDIIMDYKKLALGEAKGKGRKPITHIEFIFTMKNQQNDTEILNEKQIRELMDLADKRTFGTEKTAKEFYDYALALALEKCVNNKGFYKYIKNIIKNDTSFLGQISMFTNPDVRAAAQKKSIEVQNSISREKKEKREQALAEHNEIERLFKEGKI
jgi:plasmid replication initiation protein